MSDVSVEEYGYSRSSIQVMAATLFTLAFIAPFMGTFGVTGGSILVNLTGMTWNLSVGDRIHFTWNFSYVVLTVPLLLFKSPFIYWFYRVYKGEKNASSAVSLGIVSELVIVILNVPVWLIWLSSSYFAVLFPLPLTLVAGLIMLRLRPPKQTAKWMADEEGEEWWSGSDPATSHDDTPGEIQLPEDDEIWPSEG